MTQLFLSSCTYEVLQVSIHPSIDPCAGLSNNGIKHLKPPIDRDTVPFDAKPGARFEGEHCGNELGHLKRQSWGCSSKEWGGLSFYFHEHSDLIWFNQLNVDLVSTKLSVKAKWVRPNIEHWQYVYTISPKLWDYFQLGKWWSARGWTGPPYFQTISYRKSNKYSCLLFHQQTLGERSSILTTKCNLPIPSMISFGGSPIGLNHLMMGLVVPYPGQWQKKTDRGLNSTRFYKNWLIGRGFIQQTSKCKAPQ